MTVEQNLEKRLQRHHPSTIWKYSIELNGFTHILVPTGAKLLSVQSQNGCLCAWFAVNPRASKVARVLAVVGTGHCRPDTMQSGEFKATVQIGMLVWHIYDMGEDYAR